MKKTISSGINKGSVKVKTDFKIVKNVSSCITDGYFEYYNSKYQFSDFFNKNYQDDSWVTKKPFLLNSKNGFFYNQDKVGLELAYRDLMSLYQDLDICLKRLQDGFHDSMFIRFVFKIGMFTTQAHWELVCRNWYRGFSMALSVVITS